MRSLSILVVLAGVVTAAAAAPSHATFPGTNGRIVFEADVKGTVQLFTIDPSGSGLKQLTHLRVPKGDDGVDSPAWSPDGTHIVFGSDHARSKPHSGGDLYVITSAGSGLRRIALKLGAFTGQPTYAPDGNRIAFTWTGNVQGWHPGGIDIANLSGRGVRRVSEQPKGAFDGSADWSPDGQWIAFVRGSGHSVIFKIRLDGTGLEQLTPPAMDAANPKWSPDGSRILFNDVADPKPGKDANVFTMNADGGDVVQLTHLAGGVKQAYVSSWSPDGTQVLYHLRGADSRKGLNQLFVMNADGSGNHPLTHMPAGSNPRSAAWGTAK